MKTSSYMTCGQSHKHITNNRNLQFYSYGYWLQMYLIVIYDRLCFKDLPVVESKLKSNKVNSKVNNEKNSTFLVIFWVLTWITEKKLSAIFTKICLFSLVMTDQPTLGYFPNSLRSLIVYKYVRSGSREQWSVFTPLEGE